MDVTENFKENLEVLAHSGFKLTDLEVGLIENSLTILQSSQKFEKIFFFGKIETSSADTPNYYIAFGYQNDIFKDQKAFYSQNGYEWVMMPEMKEKLLSVTLRSMTLLTGDPMNVENVCMMPTFISDTENVYKSCRPKTKALKEEDKLACMVHLLMTQAAVMPRGLLYRQVTRSIAYNPCFQGLNRMEANEMTNFQLFRYPQNNRNYNLTKHENFNYQTDFFDTIDDILPQKCCFKFHMNESNSDICLIRALYWPGMIFFHKLNTKYQGFVYFGNGKRNLDLLFMT